MDEHEALLQTSASRFRDFIAGEDVMPRHQPTA